MLLKKIYSEYEAYESMNSDPCVIYNIYTL